MRSDGRHLDALTFKSLGGGYWFEKRLRCLEKGTLISIWQTLMQKPKLADLFESVTVEDGVTTRTRLPSLFLTHVLLMQPLKTGEDVQSQTPLAVAASEEEAVVFGGCLSTEQIKISHENQADYGIN